MKNCFIILCLSVFGSVYGQDSLGQQWKYKKSISILNKENKILTDYQVSFIFSTDSLIAEGKLNANLSDIRITSSDGKTPLCFWIDRETNNNALVSVKVPILKPKTEETVFMFYGNPSAQAIDDPDCTFMLYDNFNGDTIDHHKWQLMGTQMPVVLDGKIVFEAENTNQMILTKASYERPMIVEMKVLNASGSTISFSQLVRSEFGWIGGYSLDLNQKEHSVQIDLLEPSNCGAYAVAGMHAAPALANEIQGIWSLLWITDNEIIAHWPGGSISKGNIFNSARQIKAGMGILACNTGKKQSGKLEVDWIRIRKYASVIPEVLIGNEILENIVSPTISPAPYMLEGIS